MNQEEFEAVFEEVVGKSRTVLVEKAKEYAVDGDRMHNFKIAAGLTGGTPEQALWGMLVKHLVSIRDMVLSGKNYPEGVWDEKVGDALNYLILLRAQVEETNKPLIKAHSDTIISRDDIPILHGAAALLADPTNAVLHGAAALLADPTRTIN